MTSAQQRAALQSQIWKIANDVRGSVDGWDFKQYVLGTLFYRFISVSLKREFASKNGTELNSTLPKMSPLNPEYKTKKQSVFQKIAAFIEKFKSVGGQI